MTPVLVVADVTLVWFGTLSVRSAVIVAVIVEVLLWSFLVSRVVAGIRRYRASRAASNTHWDAVEDAVAELMPRRLARVMVYEPRLWICIVRWVARRHDGRRPGGFACHSALRVSFTIFIGLTVFEGVLVEGIVALASGNSIWTWMTLGVHLYCVIWLVGWYASYVTLPHRLTEETLRLRDGFLGELVIPCDAITGARKAPQSNFFRSGLKIKDTRRKTALLAHGDATVELILDPTCTVTFKRAPYYLNSVALTVDDPDSFLAALASTTEMCTVETVECPYGLI